ncbi:MAG: hypothetical protein F7C35_09075 [Desulfurococcales archaeon]|nr:hypothetical protein [Desulfurococcales archaeon]
MSGEEKREEARKVLVELEASKAGGQEDIKEILDAVSAFIKSLSEPLEKLLNTVLKTIEGERLGAEVAAFYKSLVDAGMPQDLAAEMTREFFRKRISMLDLAGLIKEFVKKEIIEEEKEGEEEKEE